jgi:opacity protein-like surface antigen
MATRTGVLFLSLCVFSGAASAQSSDRAGTWEFGVSLADFGGEDISGDGGSALSIDNDLGFGFEVNYNLTSRFAVGGGLDFSSPDYQATRVVEGSNLVDKVSASLDVWTIHLKGTFYFTEGALAPYVEAGAGWTSVDSNIADGPPTTGCWWDPWWGYVCSSFYDTYSETRTSYSYGVGIRWEIADEFVVRASYGPVEVDTERGQDASLDVTRVEFAWRF